MCGGSVRVAARRERRADSEALDADELGQRVAARALERRAGPLDIGRERRRQRPERPDERRAPGGADRPVAVLERRVGLAREGRRLAHLERRLAREADAPARARGRRSTLGGRIRAAAPRARPPRRPRRARAAWPRCARSSASTVVAKRVCTTDRSSAKSRTIARSVRAASGALPSAVIATVVRARRAPRRRRAPRSSCPSARA